MERCMCVTILEYLHTNPGINFYLKYRGNILYQKANILGTHEREREREAPTQPLSTQIAYPVRVCIVGLLYIYVPLYIGYTRY